MPSSDSTSDKRRHIIATAYRLFARDGFHATGIDRIIAEAGVAKMTMYRHFPGKDGLIVAVLHHRAARFGARLDRLTVSAATASGQISEIVDWYRRWFARRDFHGCAFAHALAEFGTPGHPVFLAVAAQKNEFRGRLGKILERDLSEAAAARTAATLFMLFEGATLLAETGRGEEAITGLRAGVTAILAGAEVS